VSAPNTPIRRVSYSPGWCLCGKASAVLLDFLPNSPGRCVERRRSAPAGAFKGSRMNPHNRPRSAVTATEAAALYDQPVLDPALSRLIKRVAEAANEIESGIGAISNFADRLGASDAPQSASPCDERDAAAGALGEIERLAGFLEALSMRLDYSARRLNQVA